MIVKPAQTDVIVNFNVEVIIGPKFFTKSLRVSTTCEVHNQIVLHVRDNITSLFCAPFEEKDFSASKCFRAFGRLRFRHIAHIDYFYSESRAAKNHDFCVVDVHNHRQTALFVFPPFSLFWHSSVGNSFCVVTATMHKPRLVFICHKHIGVENIARRTQRVLVFQLVGFFDAIKKPFDLRAGKPFRKRNALDYIRCRLQCRHEIALIFFARQLDCPVAISKSALR